MKTHLVRKSEPSKLTYIGELLSGRNFSPKMVRREILTYKNSVIILVFSLSLKVLNLNKINANQQVSMMRDGLVVKDFPSYPRNHRFEIYSG
jgi:hypothetical protein